MILDRDVNEVTKVEAALDEEAALARARSRGRRVGTIIAIVGAVALAAGTFMLVRRFQARRRPLAQLARTVAKRRPDGVAPELARKVALRVVPLLAATIARRLARPHDGTKTSRFGSRPLNA